ncbi:MAG: carbohydrate-binding domain-containing protein [Geosporobacter ferrireducens]|nr:carbohydrate-binding domain-containing protein [Geosporobacter ferrireducens]
MLLCVAFLASCGTNSALEPNIVAQEAEKAEANSNTQDHTNSGTVTADQITYDQNDAYSDWKSENPNYIELKGSTASIKGSGASVKDNVITITAAGVYVISGKLDNGQIVVEVANKGIVKLVLNEMQIHNKDSAPIYVKKAGKAIISLQDGTENMVTDGENYIFSEASEDEPNAAIFSKADLTINGTGTLRVKGNYNNGISSKDDLKILGGNIHIASADDGLMGRDKVLVKEGNIRIEAGGDGIKSTNDTDPLKGFIAIEAGRFDITAGADAIQAKTSVLITGGDFDIVSGGGSANASEKAGNMGKRSFESVESPLTAETDESESQSTKGIKASADITIKGGKFNIDSADDAIHSNNSITIAGGDISIASGDDGIHGDASIKIEGGKINITKSYEGIESALISIIDGEIYVVSKDDGINVAGGKDQSALQGRPGQNNFRSSGNNRLDIDGGYVVIDAAGDGLDANGSIYMNAGTVIVNGPMNNGNGALDYDGVFEINGGMLIAAGSSGMVQAPSEQSKQYSINMMYSQMQEAGRIVHLQDSKGNTIVTFAPQKSYQSIVISSPELKKDSSYTLYAGGTSTGNEKDGLYTNGAYQGGSKIVDFTITDSVTWLSEAGVTTGRNPMPGGPNNPGFDGNRNRPEKRKE